MSGNAFDAKRRGWPKIWLSLLSIPQEKLPEVIKGKKSCMTSFSDSFKLIRSQSESVILSNDIMIPPFQTLLNELDLFVVWKVAVTRFVVVSNEDVNTQKENTV